MARVPRWPSWITLFVLGTGVPALLLAIILIAEAPIVGWEEPGKYLRISRGLLEHGALVESKPLYGTDVSEAGASPEWVLVPALERLPAYPIFVAVLWWLGWSGSYVWIAAAQCLMGGLFAVAIAAAGTALRPAWFWPAGLLATAWPNVQWQATIVMPEMLLAAALAGGLAAALWLPCARRPWFVAGLSALGFGVAFMTKPQLILMPVLLTPGLWWYLERSGMGRGRAAGLAAVPVVAMLLLAGLQVARVQSAYGVWLFTTHSNDHALFFVWPCLNTRFGCGDPNLEESRRALVEFRQRMAALPHEEMTNLIVQNRVKGEIFREYLAAADKVAVARAVAGSYVKALMHTVVLSVLQRFDREVTYLSATPGEGFDRLVNFASRVFGDGAMRLWLAAQLLLVATRIVQVIGTLQGLRDPKLRAATVLLLLCSAAVLATVAGIGNPRYRVAAEPMLLLLTVIGGDALWQWRRSRR